MKSLLKKVRGDKKGFTLAELLVVVAIIGILVAISIPVFTAQLGKARVATNKANMRAAKAAALAEFLTAEGTRKNGDIAQYKYVVSTGQADDDSTASLPAVVAIDNVRSDALYTDIYVTVTAGNDGEETVELHPSPAAN